MRKLNKNTSIKNTKKFPSEIKRFYIPERSLEKLIGAKIGGPVESIDMNREGVELDLPYSIFEKLLEERYNKEINSTKLDGEQVTIDISDDENTEKVKTDERKNGVNFEKISQVLKSN
ncbi:hypothetical protein AKJ39_00340 [candidate division MSBL1 archaeon SCGC-AAA259J03]|uniref:Uncharacterized protein n=1 Tax=candidate division MSBL1 archaeon SCGC-AAA259J03 TaxID=1698269 RepID=A0A656Z030_9EURY|nr:hypothetical protein AKJ39_00340 [candidate division MSBL1 archaeon SCGC-AAA259J03]